MCLKLAKVDWNYHEFQQEYNKTWIPSVQHKNRNKPFVRAKNNVNPESDFIVSQKTAAINKLYTQ